MLRVFVIGYFRQERFDDLEKSGGHAIRNRDLPAAKVRAQRDQPGLACQHFHCNLENAPEQLIQVEFLGKRAGNFEQVIALADAEIGQHD